MDRPSPKEPPPEWFHLAPYEGAHAELIAGWASTQVERELWMAQPELEVDATVFGAWHAEDGCTPFVLVEKDELCGYGELWEDPAAGEVELARLLVAPDHRGRGVGRRLVEQLVMEARRRGGREIWLRVFPQNHVARACYRSFHKFSYNRS